MAVGLATVVTSDKAGKQNDKFSATVSIPGTLGASTEAIIMLPAATNGWELSAVVLAAGVNTTHSTGGLVSATVEKNTDGGTSALTTNPSMDDTQTGRQTSANGLAGNTAAVIKTDGGEDFASYDTAFVTVTQAGSGGAAALDTSVLVEFTRKADYDPDYTAA